MAKPGAGNGDCVVPEQPNLQVRTKLDDDFDRIRDSYLAHGVTLETIMATLEEMCAGNEWHLNRSRNTYNAGA